MSSKSVTTLDTNLVSLGDAASMLGFHERTIRRAISAGQLTGYAFGARAIRVRVSDLERWVESKTIPNARSGRGSR